MIIMMVQQGFFLTALSLQVAGALILIVFYWGNTKRRILNTIYSSNTMLQREDNNKVIIAREKLIKAHREVLLNRIAFIFIVLGFLLSLFGDNEGLCSWCGLIIVLLESCIWIGLGLAISFLVAKACNKEDWALDYNEVVQNLDCDVATNAANSEIDDLFEQN